LVLVQIRRCNETKKGIPVGNKGGIPFYKKNRIGRIDFHKPNPFHLSLNIFLFKVFIIPYFNL
jgi:hypothetical protein